MQIRCLEQLKSLSVIVPAISLSFLTQLKFKSARNVINKIKLSAKKGNFKIMEFIQKTYD